jgi:hypothetical protein
VQWGLWVAFGDDAMQDNVGRTLNIIPAKAFIAPEFLGTE